MAMTTRAGKGSKLTHQEMDDNFYSIGEDVLNVYHATMTTTNNNYTLIGWSGGGNSYIYLYSLGYSPIPMYCNGTIGFLDTAYNWQVYSLAAGSWNVVSDCNVVGDVHAYYSDERLKTKIGPIESALDKLMTLEGFYYIENDLARSYGYDCTDVQVGCSAQSVEAVLPEVVVPAPFDIAEDGGSKTGENYKTLEYARMLPLLIQSLKELNEEVVQLENELSLIEGGA